MQQNFKIDQLYGVYNQDYKNITWKADTKCSLEKPFAFL